MFYAHSSLLSSDDREEGDEEMRSRRMRRRRSQVSRGQFSIETSLRHRSYSLGGKAMAYSEK